MQGLAATSFLLNAVAFGLVTVLLLVGWEGRRAGGRLILACAASALWGVVLAWDGALARVSPAALLLVEGVRSGTWLMVVGGFATGGGTATWLRAWPWRTKPAPTLAASRR